MDRNGNRQGMVSSRSPGFQDEFAVLQIVLDLNSSQQQKLFCAPRAASQMRGLVRAMTHILYPTSAGQVRHRSSIVS